MTIVIALAGFALSMALAAVRLWEVFFLRAQFDVEAQWVLDDGVPTLRIALFNVGRRRGTVRDLRLQEGGMDTSRGWTPYEGVARYLPAVLEGDAATVFEVSLPPVSSAEYPRDAGVEWLLEDALRAGRIRALVLENGRGDAFEFSVPDLPSTLEAWRTGRDVFRGSGNHARLYGQLGA